MPDIKITDNFGLDLTVSPATTSALTKYFQNEARLKFNNFNFSAIKEIKLNSVPAGESKASLQFSDPVNVGITDVQLKIGAGASAAFSVLLSRDNDNLKNDVFGDPLTIASDQGYIQFSATANVSADLNDKLNDLKFGFNAASQIQFSNSRQFDLKAAPTLLDALKDTLANFTVPGDIDDLKAIAPGTICSVDGTGSLKFSGNFELDFLNNPLASISLPVISTPVKISSGGSFKIAASVTLSGEYQLRVKKQGPNIVQFGFFRKSASQFQISVGVSAGLSAGFGSTDLIEKLFTAISKNPEADKKELKAAGLDDATINAIASAIKGGVQRRLEIAFQSALSDSTEHNAVALYELDLTALDDVSRPAVHQALEGDLSGLVDGLKGVKLIRTVHQDVSTRKHSTTVNLLGIFNFLSLTQMVTSGKVLFDAQTGSLVITDSVTGTRIRASLLNFAADPDKLRTVYAQSFVITAAYRGSKTAITDPTLTSAFITFESHASTNLATMKRMLLIPRALGLLSDSEASALLPHLNDFGRTSLFAEDRFNESLCKQLFLNNTQARPATEYEQAGRKALALLVPQGDPDDYRRLIATDDAVWNQIKAIGNVTLFGQVLPQLSKLQLSIIGQDFTTIIWWTQSMSAMAKALEQVEAFFANNPNPDPGNHQLVALQKNLTKAMAHVISDTKPEFGQPWGMIALHQILGGRSQSAVQITSKVLSLKKATTLERATTA